MSMLMLSLPIVQITRPLEKRHVELLIGLSDTDMLIIGEQVNGMLKILPKLTLYVRD
jgi:hypothetical protein